MTHQLLPYPFYKVQFPANIQTLHNPKTKILTISPSHSEVQKAQEERNQVKANRNHSGSLNHLPPPEEEEHCKETNNYYHNENYRGNNRGCKPYRGNKVVAENLIEALNKGEGDSKTIIGANTKATTDNSTTPMEAIIITIITVIIKAEVDVAMVAIITEVMAAGEAIIEVITITNTTNTTHMMMVHRWNNMAHHAHFAVVLITLLSIVLKEIMT